MGFKVRDHYYRKAKQEGLLARSVYKLEEIDRKYRLFRPGDSVVDLGCLPGSWSSYAARRVGPRGRVIGVDKRVDVAGGKGVIRRDIFSLVNLSDLGLEKKVHVLLSDMAPNTTGIKSVDQAQSLRLVEGVFGLMEEILASGGVCVVKVFEGAEAQEVFRRVRGFFATFKLIRPKATRSSSKEIFAVGLRYRGGD